MELIGKLGIDVKLLLAQVVNFAILAFVLAKFVFKPVFAMLDKRRAMIAKSADDAKRSEELLSGVEQMRAAAVEQIKRQATEMLAAAAKSADETKASILESARAEAQALYDQTRLHIAQERETMLRDVRQELGSLVIAVTEKILMREFSPEDQKRLLQSALQELEQTRR